MFCLGALENIVGKGENAGDQHFLLFQQYFNPFNDTAYYFIYHQEMI